jgi:hypothetical protein
MEKESTFLVTHADDESAVLHDTADGQVHTLAENPGIEVGDAVEGTIVPDGPMELAWELTDCDERRSLRTEHSAEPPTSQERELADTQEIGELTTSERAGIGEIHVLTVPSERVPEAVEDVLDDEATLVRAARLGVNRVEVRSDPDTGVVAVRYLP